MRYLVLHNRRQYGPFEETEIQELLAAGILTFNDPVALEGTSKFQAMANTDLIFTKEVISSHPTEFFPKGDDLCASKKLSQTDEAAATMEGYTVSPPEITPSASFTRKLWITVKKSCKALPEFILNKILSQKKMERSIIGKALSGFISKLYAWLTLLGVSLLVQKFFFSKIFSVLFKFIFPDTGPIGVTFTGQMVEMIIVFITYLYTMLTMALMTIIGAAKLYDHTSFSFKELYVAVQRKIPIFCLIISEFSLMIIAMVMATVLLPDILQFTGKYFVVLIFITVANRLLAVPFMIILEDIGIIEAHRISCILMRKQFKPIFYYGLGYILIEICIDIPARNLHYLSALKYLLQLFTLIFATYYYKELSNKALIRRHKGREL